MAVNRCCRLELCSIAGVSHQGRSSLSMPDYAPGVGPLVATPAVAAVADGSAFSRGWDLAEWLGLLPRQMSTDGKTRLGDIIKRGNRHLRQVFIHGARSFKMYGNRSPHYIGAWFDELERRTYNNMVTVALANKLARIVCSVLANETEHRSLLS